MARLDAPVNEWGIPDWRKPEDYGCTENWDWDRWCWEFTRRRADYRSDFKAAWTSWAGMTIQPPDPAAAFKSRRREHLVRVPSPPKGAAAKYELTCFFDPIVSEWPTRDPLPNTELLPGDGPKWIGPSWPDTGFDAFSRWSVFSGDLPESVVPCSFDLSKPLGPQLKEAKQVLEEWQMRWEGFGEIAVVRTKRHTGKWLIYLRALDARADGASLSAIADILPPHMAGGPNTASNVLKQAESVFRFKGDALS